MSSFSAACRSLRTLCPYESVMARSRRAFHASTSRQALIAPPDPVSHMRPILYDDRPMQSPPAYLRHPYSLSEFKDGPGNTIGDNELQFTLLRQQLDSLHQTFWLDSNTRFYAAKEAILCSLPTDATVRDKEDALSEFYKQWVQQEMESTDQYTAEWRRRNSELITLGARVEFHKMNSRISDVFRKTPKQ